MEVTAAIVAVKPALVALAATVIVTGTVTDTSLLERLTVRPPLGAAPLNVTVQASLPAPVMAPLVHVKPVNVGMGAVPVPLSVTTVVGPVEELLVMVSWPAADPALVGSNCTVTYAVWPGFNVAGKLPPRIEKPDPLAVTELTVRAAVPEELRVTVCVVVAFSVTLPKTSVFELRVKVGVLAVSCNATVFETLAALAVKVAVCVELTAAIVAAKLALVALGGTVTVAGTVTAASLLASATVNPPVEAPVFNVTVQASVPDPVSDPLAHEKPLSATTGLNCNENVSE